MPWIALLCLGLVGACRFDADYTGATVRCESDGKCPSGLICREDLDFECREPFRDAAVDTPMNMDSPDASIPDFDCFKPGILVSGQTANGSTMGRMNRMTSFCGGGVQNAPDAVYKITTTAPNKQLVVNVTGLSAYVLNACMHTPNTAACLGSQTANPGSAISVTAAATGDYYVVVDNLNVTVDGLYTLLVDVQ